MNIKIKKNITYSKKSSTDICDKSLGINSKWLPNAVRWLHLKQQIQKHDIITIKKNTSTYILSFFSDILKIDLRVLRFFLHQ